MSEEEREITERFDRIKKAAWNDEPLPEDMELRCDLNCYHDLMRLFSGHRILKNIGKEELFKKGSDYKNAYITEYRHTVLQKKIYSEDHSKRMRASQIQAKLIKGDMSCKEIFEAVFCELIPALTDEVTGKLIRDNAGLKLWTGVGNLRTEEIEKINEANGFRKAE